MAVRSRHLDTLVVYAAIEYASKTRAGRKRSTVDTPIPSNGITLYYLPFCACIIFSQSQNQPALEKDRYKIRSAFTCAPGNALIVADYGQLELRLLAHMTKCKSMIEAFKAGGDFHSRTALGMYDYIREKVSSYCLQ